MEYGDNDHFVDLMMQNNENRPVQEKIGDVLLKAAAAATATAAAVDGGSEVVANESGAGSAQANECKSSDREDFIYAMGVKEGTIGNGGSEFEKMLLQEKQSNGNGISANKDDEYEYDDEKPKQLFCEYEPEKEKENESRNTPFCDSAAFMSNDFATKQERESHDNLALEEDEDISSVTTTFETSSPSENPTPLDSELVGDGLSFEQTQSKISQFPFAIEKDDEKEDDFVAAGQTSPELLSPSQLNPDAAEFVPCLESQLAPAIEDQNKVLNAAGGDAIEEVPRPKSVSSHLVNEFEKVLSESPRKGPLANMDCISLPPENIFDDEADQRPHELEPVEHNLQRNGVSSNDFISGPETSVDLDADNDDIHLELDESDTQEALCAVTSEFNNISIVDVLNSVQPLPTDEEFGEFDADDSHTVGTKELLNFEEKERVSTSPSIEEFHQNPCENAGVLLATAGMQQSLYLGRSSDNVEIPKHDLESLLLNNLEVNTQAGQDSLVEEDAFKQDFSIDTSMPKGLNDDHSDFSTVCEKHLIEETKEQPAFSKDGMRIEETKEGPAFSNYLNDEGNNDVTLPIDEVGDVPTKTSSEYMQGNNAFDSINVHHLLSPMSRNELNPAPAIAETIPKNDVINYGSFGSYGADNAEFPVKEELEEKCSLVLSAQPTSDNVERSNIETTNVAPIDSEFVEPMDGNILEDIEENPLETEKIELEHGAKICDVAAKTVNVKIESEGTEKIVNVESEKDSKICQEKCTSAEDSTKTVVSTKEDVSVNERKEPNNKNKCKTISSATKTSTATTKTTVGNAKLSTSAAAVTVPKSTDKTSTMVSTSRKPVPTGSTLNSNKHTIAAKNDTKSIALSSRASLDKRAGRKPPTTTTTENTTTSLGKTKSVTAATSKLDPIGAAAKPKPKLITPRATLTSQLRKAAGPPSNPISVTSNKNVAKQATSTTGGTATKTVASSTTRAGTGGTTVVQAKPFTARPAPKFSNSTLQPMRRTAVSATATKTSPGKSLTTKAHPITSSTALLTKNKAPTGNKPTEISESKGAKIKDPASITDECSQKAGISNAVEPKSVTNSLSDI